MVSALSYAIYIVGVNQSTLKNLATLPLTFYVLLFGLGLFLVRGYAFWPFSPNSAIGSALR